MRNNFYSIRAPSVFQGLDAFSSVTFHNIDELHWFTNISKTLMDMISPKYNQAYKYICNESEYPFVLSNTAIIAMRDALNSSRHLIPSSAFSASFKGYDPQNSKSYYRSVDYIGWLRFVLPLYIPLFEDRDVADEIACLVRGVCLGLQFSISTDDCFFLMMVCFASVTLMRGLLS